MGVGDRMGCRLAVLSPIITFSTIFVSILLSPWFSWTGNALSDLGNYNNGLLAAVIFNSGLVITGILILIFAVNLYLKQEHPILRIGSIFLILTSMLQASVGILTENAGHIHFTVSVSFFFSLLLTILICGFGWILKGDRSVGIVSLILPTLPAWLWTLPWGGVAIPETVSGVAGFAWILMLAFHYQNP